MHRSREVRFARIRTKAKGGLDRAASAMANRAGVWSIPSK